MLVLGLILMGLTWHSAMGPMCGEYPNPCADVSDRLTHSGEAKLFLLGALLAVIAVVQIPWGLWQIRNERRATLPPMSLEEMRRRLAELDDEEKH
ncbi:hypothetical protein ACIQ9Q_25110 [Streptomyces sp. NPDC094438]|uniref:hypothetical protein n=1 Tax=Streptomyces sp. NPDC094438 TaxID=3366061 RepID=UPI00382D4AE8